MRSPLWLSGCRRRGLLFRGWYLNWIEGPCSFWRPFLKILRAWIFRSVSLNIWHSLGLVTGYPAFIQSLRVCPVPSHLKHITPTSLGGVPFPATSSTTRASSVLVIRRGPTTLLSLSFVAGASRIMSSSSVSVLVIRIGNDSGSDVS